MNYLIGAVVGVLLGGVIGYLKNIFIWKRYAEGEYSDSQAQASLAKVYVRVFVSYTINILVLVGVFLLRNQMPFDGIACLIGTAIALAIMNRILAMKQRATQ